MKFRGYRCSICGSEYGPCEQLYLCPKDRGCLDVVLDTDGIRKTVKPSQLAGPGLERSHWRYLPLLPVDDPGAEGTPLRRVGWTPLYSLPALRARLGLKAFWLKDDGANPTSSFKDRASSLVAARARQIGAATVVTSSTGNAGAARWVAYPSGYPMLGTPARAEGERLMATVELNSENFESTVGSADLALVDFWAAWCGPCRMFGPVFEQASEANPDAVFGKVDTEAQQRLAAMANITSIPTLMAFRDQILVFSQPGALPPAALDQVITAVKDLDMDEVRRQLADSSTETDSA